MSFLEISIKRLQDYKRLAEKAMAQIGDDALLRDAASAQDNSVVVIVKHMSGNMRSRWTNFLTEDGEKPWRQRDNEFVHETLTREGLFELWEEGWACVFNTLHSMQEADLDSIVHIRKEPLSAMDAIIRQLMHYSYHVGQIVTLCRQAAGDSWTSLSVPRGGSAAFNATMMGSQTQ